MRNIRAMTAAAVAVGAMAIAGTALGLALSRSPHVTAPAAARPTVAAVAITQSVSGCTAYMRAADKRDPRPSVPAAFSRAARSRSCAVPSATAVPLAFRKVRDILRA